MVFGSVGFQGGYDKDLSLMKDGECVVWINENWGKMWGLMIIGVQGGVISLDSM